MIVKREIHITTRKQDNNFIQMEKKCDLYNMGNSDGHYIVVCTYKSGGKNKGMHSF